MLDKLLHGVNAQITPCVHTNQMARANEAVKVISQRAEIVDVIFVVLVEDVVEEAQVFVN